jgi:peptidyl-prolyl cis-trans isomerase C
MNRQLRQLTINVGRTTEGSLSVLLAMAGIFALGVGLGVSAARAQGPVAAHTPTDYTPQAFGATTTFQPVGRAVVKVNGVALTDRDLLREMIAIFPYARQHNGFPKAMEADIRSGALRMLIFEELVYQEAKHRNMAIPPAQLAQAAAEFRQQFHSSQGYQEFLKAEFDGSQAALQVKIERSLLIDRLLKKEIADKSAVTPAEVKAWYDQHPDRFRVAESFSFQSISVLPPHNATAAQLAEARRRAALALSQAQATSSYQQFGLLAEKISEDDFRVMMGDHKAADRSKLPAVVATALAAMQPGQVSELVQFDVNSYTILRLNAHTPAGMQKFEAVRDTLRDKLIRDRNEQLRSALATRLSKNARIEKA